MNKSTHRFPAFTTGVATDAYQYLGAHPLPGGGFVFRVWAPTAQKVSLVGDFNGWDESVHTMFPLGDGLWEVQVPHAKQYDNYKFSVTGADSVTWLKADPYAFHAETRPGNASKVYDLSGYTWGDEAWLKQRKKNLVYDHPLNIYEVHLGSWRRTGDGEFLSYRDMAQYLPGYVKEMGFTHVEFMPVTEHPLDASWGYQVTGYFAATSRFGTPHDFMYLVDSLHQAGVGVILDWVPAHFPKDRFGLYQFDGSPTYEYADPRKGEHADWGTMVFDYERYEVRSFLFSSANFWLSEYHIDGIRVDAVASMLYLDYGRQDGQWVPNKDGGNHNYEAEDFLQRLNEKIFALHPDCLMIAEESTAWTGVTHPTTQNGLGFNLKWNMGWMNDILHYIKLDPYFRQFNHRDITFSLMYAFSENFLLPLSHDEVVHMKGSLLNKMPGDDVLKYAGVRVFYGYMLTHPGKKLTMMGSEFGQWNEWHYEQSLDWNLLDQQDADGQRHRDTQAYFKAANDFYLKNPALWQQDFSWEGFEWLAADDNQNNVIAFLRKDKKGKYLMVVCNFSPVTRENYRIGVLDAGQYEVVFSSDDPAFGGNGLTPTGTLQTDYLPMHDREQSLALTLPPMSTMILKCTKKFPKKKPAGEKKAPAKKAATSPSKKPATKSKPSAEAKVEKASSVKKSSSAPKKAAPTPKGSGVSPVSTPEKSGAKPAATPVSSGVSPRKTPAKTPAKTPKKSTTKS